MYIKNKKGQSTVEYILLVTAVLAVIIVFVTGNKSMFKTTLVNAVNSSIQDINTEAAQFSGSHTASSPSGGTEPIITINVDKGLDVNNP